MILGAMSTVFWGMGGVSIRSVGNFMNADLEKFGSRAGN